MQASKQPSYSWQLNQQHAMLPNAGKVRFSDKKQVYHQPFQRLYWLLPYPWKQKVQLVIEGGDSLEWQGANGGDWGTSAALLPATSSSTLLPRQHRQNDPSILQGDIHFIKIEYCEDTWPQNELSAVQEQHKCLCTILQGASFWESLEWVAPSTTITHWSLLRSWGLTLWELRNTHSVYHAA